MFTISIVMLIISKAIEHFSKASGTLVKAPKTIQNAEFTLAQITNNISGLVGAALLVAAVGGSFYFILQAISDLVETLDKTDVSPEVIAEMAHVIKGIVIVLGVVLGAMAIITAIVAKLSGTVIHEENKLKKMTKTTKTIDSTTTEVAGLFASMGLAIIAMAGAVWLLVDAIKTMSVEDIKPQAFIVVYGTMISIMGLCAIMVKEMNTSSFNEKALYGLAVLIAVIAGVMYLIINQMTLLATTAALAMRTGNGEAMAVSIGAVLVSYAVIFAGVAALLKQAYLVNGKSIKALGAIVFGVAAGVYVAGIAISTMVKAWTKVPKEKFGQVVLGMVVSLGVFAAITALLAKLSYQLNDWKSSDVLKKKRTFKNAHMVTVIVNRYHRMGYGNGFYKTVTIDPENKF